MVKAIVADGIFLTCVSGFKHPYLLNSGFLTFLPPLQLGRNFLWTSNAQVISGVPRSPTLSAQAGQMDLRAQLWDDLSSRMILLSSLSRSSLASYPILKVTPSEYDVSQMPTLTVRLLRGVKGQLIPIRWKVMVTLV